VNNQEATKSLRAGIVGGGQGAFIGRVHKIAVELDGIAQVVAGAMSSDPQRAQDSAKAWGLSRSYGSYMEMANEEALHPEGIDFVIIATPNHLHTDIARAFLAKGIHVMCDKPLSNDISEAHGLSEFYDNIDNTLFGLTHTYAGYPAVMEAQAIVASGSLGIVRKVLVEYQQDWLMFPLEQNGDNKQASWRTDPTKAGISCCVGDIGTHAAHLAELVSGQQISELAADLSCFVAGRRLDDDASMLLRFNGGAKGVLLCSQIAAGEENRLSLRIYGSEGSLEWQQEEPNTLIIKMAGEPWHRHRTGKTLHSAAAQAAIRVPAGHPEGYLEAKANLYCEFMADIKRLQRGEMPLKNYPGMTEGIRGMRFIQAAVSSSEHNARWMPV
jgi:predicted dehydrogenase